MAYSWNTPGDAVDNAVGGTNLLRDQLNRINDRISDCVTRGDQAKMRKLLDLRDGVMTQLLSDLGDSASNAVGADSFRDGALRELVCLALLPAPIP